MKPFVALHLPWKSRVPFTAPPDVRLPHQDQRAVAGTNPLRAFARGAVIALAGIAPALVLANDNGPTSPTVPDLRVEGTGGQVLFLENAGQVHDTENNRRDDIRFTVRSGDVTLFIHDTGIHYQFTRMGRMGERPKAALPGMHEDDEGALPGTFSLYRLDMMLVGSNPHPRILRENRSGYHENHYSESSPEGVMAQAYEKVVFQDVYPSIDWVLYSNGGTMKYDFVVRPGGDPSRIRMRYDHADHMALRGTGELFIGTTLGSVVEGKPFTYRSAGRSSGKEEVASRYVLDGNVVSFVVEGHDTHGTLVIDPSLVWATYYGGTGTDRGRAVATDASGNVIMGGQTATSGLATAGGHQEAISTNGDGFIVKFNPGGQRLWATYYGGTASDQIWSLATDADGNIYAGGETASTSAMSTAGAHQVTKGAGTTTDAFLVKFSGSGARLWGTYYGGSQRDYGYAVSVDGSGSVYLAGYTGSAEGIATTGSHKASKASTSYDDAFLVKFNSSGVRQWGTYYGGTALTRAWGVAVDGDGHAFISGFTQTTSGIATTGAHLATYPGVTSNPTAFLAKFDPSGARQWGTYFGGTTSYDYGRQVGVDNAGNVYLSGHTGSTNGVATAGAHQTTHGGGGNDAFLAKFNGSGALQWGTYAGGSGNDFGLALSVNGSGGVFIAGETPSTSGIATPGSVQDTYGGGTWDAFLVKFDGAGARQWGTYFGGAAIDYGRSVAADQSGNVFLTGFSTSSGLALNGHQSVNNGNEDAILLRISETTHALSTGGVVGTPFCAGAPITVPFTSSSSSGSFGAGNVFTAQLSDASGGWAASVPIGTLSGSGTGSLEVSAVLPPGTPSGIGYRIRVVSSDPVVIGQDNGADLVVHLPPQGGLSTTGLSCGSTAAPPDIVFSLTGAPPYSFTYTIDGGSPQTVSGHMAGTYTIPAAAAGIYRITTLGDATGCPATELGGPVLGGTYGHDLFLVYKVGGGFEEVAWSLYQSGTNALVRTGGVFFNGQGSVPTCLPDGTFYLRVTDAGGDGIAGGYQLVLADGRRIIDNTDNFNSGGLSAIADNGAFDLPLGLDRPIFSSCDKTWWRSGEFLVAAENPSVSAMWVPGAPNHQQSATSGYEFWFHDPNGGYSHRRFRGHHESGGFSNVGATRACHLKLNDPSTWPLAHRLPEGTLLNVKVRGVVNGVPMNWGPVCRFALDNSLAACPPSKLLDTPGHAHYSCGVVRSLERGQRVYARPVRGATHYQWRFRVPAEEPTIQPVVIVTTSYILNLNTVALQHGKTYDVEVRASKDGAVTWCGTGNQDPAVLSPAWGDICLLTIAPQMTGPEVEALRQAQGPGGLRIWPNPNRGDQLWLSVATPGMTSAGDVVASVSVDVYDLSGKRIAARVLPVLSGPERSRGGEGQGEHLNTLLDLNGGLASGVYLVHVTVGDRTHVERLVVHP